MKGNPTKQEFLDTFCNRENVAKIKILGHTGKSIFSVLENFARRRHESGLYGAVYIHLLLRDEGVETPKRRQQIITARQTINRLNDDYNWLHVDIRFYSAIQTLRGAIVELTDGTKATYFSAYQWTLPGAEKSGHGNAPHSIKTSAVKWASVAKGKSTDTKTSELARLLENWFDYYWGPGVIHTIAFDFDDTIIDTYKEKIDAWIHAIDETIGKPGAEVYFLPDFISKYGATFDQKYRQVKLIVDTYPGKDEIQHHILKSNTPPEVANHLEDKRSSFRRNALFPRNKTEAVLKRHITAKLFPGARRAIEGLAWQGYSLAVASLTDEERIEKALRIANIPCIDTIVGKNEHRHRELQNYLAEKIYLIRKIANLAGIPVNRVLYIGDHHRDEDAAIEVGASFVHAKLLPQIEASHDPETLYFEDYRELANAVETVESRARARDIAPQQPINYA